MPFYRIEPFLLLCNDSISFNCCAITCLCHCTWLNMKSQIFPFPDIGQILIHNLFIFFLASTQFNEIASSCSSSVLVISMFTKGLPLCIDIVTNILWINYRINQHAHSWIWAKTARGIDIKLSITSCHKSNVVEGGVRGILWRIGKYNLILSWNLSLMN